MKLKSVHQVALFIGLIAAVSSSLGLFLVSFLLSTVSSIWIYIITAFIVFIIVFIAAHLATERFVYQKIKVIYRVIQGRGSEKAGDKQELDKVQKQVEEWATTRQTEIQSLKDQAEFRRDFIGNLAHELRTPLFSIQGYLDTLLEGGIEDKRINYDYLKRADKNLERLTVLVKDLNEISNMESGIEDMSVSKVDIVALVDEVFSLLELRAKKNKVTLQFSKDYERSIWVMVDRDKMLQVITNLVVNAIHYRKHKGFCRVRFSDMPQQILVEIQDDGIGIEEKNIPRLFERFFRVDKSRSRNEGGTGLGLAIVKHIIESHGQSINVHSEIDKGTTFSFTLAKA